MKKLQFLLISLLMPLTMYAQGWPANYGGVMLQAFFWDSYDETNWVVLEKQADELAAAFDLVWLPQSGNCGGQSMGYDDLYWFNNYNSSFGTETELRTLINSFKSKNIKTIADVVINHRKNKSNWVDFPIETYKNVTYEMKSTDICKNDDGGKAATEAQKLGLSVSNNNDTGEDWGGMRDLDHKSENVQKIVKAYLDFLKNDLGYAGFRYDMVKGYSASFTGQYNKASNPEFSVGECWDSSQTIANWINGTTVDGAIQSAAFDFQFKYVVRNATDNRNWSRLNQQNDGNWPLVSSNFNNGSYRRYAVTFVENHDTQLRKDGSSNGPLKRDTLAANAYLLAMPGTPCVFLPHWIDYSTEIKAMIAARKFAGINNQSSYTNLLNKTTVFINNIDNKLAVAVGNVTSSDMSIDTNTWKKVLEGYHYVYFLPASMNTAYIDLASGVYTGEQEAMLTAVSSSNAELVYTTNGQDPTASSTKVSSGTKITIPIGTTTLKVGLLINGQVSGILTRTYNVKKPVSTEVVIPDFCVVNPGETCAFFEAPETWTQTIKCWAWSTVNYTGGSWPGEACTKLGEAPNGNSVWKWTYQGALTTQPTQIIFSNNGSPQTADMKFVNGGYYTKNGLFDPTNAIPTIKTSHSVIPTRYYTLDGRFAGTNSTVLPQGIYIVNGKKIIR
jgi:alpha-amylase